MEENIVEIPKHGVMVKFPKIGQFKNVVSEVKHRTSFRGLDEAGQPIYDSVARNPILKFRGSVKLHGTNAGVIYTWNPTTFEYDVHIQSRNNVITPVKDNAGFATFMHRIDTDKLLANIMKYNQMDYTPTQIRVFGEWCGGNIQTGVAITGLEKMFVIFAIKIALLNWLDK